MRCKLIILAWLFLLFPAPSPAQVERPGCMQWTPDSLRSNPTEAELRCRYRAEGPGRFGLLSYAEVPVYQPDTPMPGTHITGVQGHAGPRRGESFEEWEWRVLRTPYGPDAQRVYRDLLLLDPAVAERIADFEIRLRQAGIRARRLESWRSPERQAWLFQQGRSRPGPLATTTLTSWHSQVDSLGRPAGRAVDYDVPGSQLAGFHRLVEETGLSSFGADSNDRGHVFSPGHEALAQEEVILLRLLPRVPEVTLATGLPVDRPLPGGGRDSLRALSFRFAAEPYIGRPAPGLSRPTLSGTLALAAVPLPPPAAPCRVRGGIWRILRAVFGGARCAPPRAAEGERRRAARSTGGP